MRMPRLTAFLTATAVFVSAFTFAAQAAEEVHVLNWKGYG
ncbi:MAG: spermidine/putrescine ABC transporter substrate-binding protein, partial [Mesorhizobium sp.]